MNTHKEKGGSNKGFASLEASLFLCFVFVPFFVGTLEIWGYVDSSQSVEEELSRIRATLATVNLQILTGRYGIFTRHQVTENGEGMTSLLSAYSEAAKEMRDQLKALPEIESVEVQTGFFSPRIYEPNGVPLHLNYGQYKIFRPKKMPKNCAAWQQSQASLFFVCGLEEKTELHGRTDLWKAFEGHTRKRNETYKRKEFSGRIWTSHSLRRLQRPLGSSIWANKTESEEAETKDADDGNDFQWAEHPRFGARSGYVVKVQIHGKILNSLKESKPDVYYGFLSLQQDL